MALTVTHAKTVNIADDPKAAAAGEVLPSDWNADHIVTGAPQLTADTDFFVSTTGSNSNDGLTLGTAWATPQHAADTISTYEFAGFRATVNISNGTYVGPQFNNMPKGAGHWFWKGNISDPTAVKFTEALPNAAASVDMEFGNPTIQVTIFYVTFTPLVAGSYGILLDAPDCVIDLLTCNFVAPAGGGADCVVSFFPTNTIYIDHDIGVTGNWTTFLNLSTTSYNYVLFDTGSHLTMNGTPAFSTAFMDVSGQLNAVHCRGTTFTGSATGKRFLVADGSVILTGTNNLELFPGNAVGQIEPIGQYDKYAVVSFSDTMVNILAVSPDVGLNGFASDYGVTLVADGTSWNVDSSYFTPQASAHDIGSQQFSNRIGYGKNYVTDKLLSNCAIGFGSVSNPVDGQLRHFTSAFFGTEVLQIYQNGEWETLPANVTLRDNQSTQNHALEHFPLTNTWVRVFSGDSESVGLNGLPLIQGYQVDLGAYPAQQQITGGTF